jgi:hypothetical protein
LSEQHTTVSDEVQKAAGKRTPQDAELAAMKKIDSILADLDHYTAARVITWCSSRAQQRYGETAQLTAKSVATEGLRGAVRSVQQETF